MPLWLFSLYMDGVFRTMKDRVGTVGVEMGMYNVEWKFNLLISEVDRQ